MLCLWCERQTHSYDFVGSWGLFFKKWETPFYSFGILLLGNYIARFEKTYAQLRSCMLHFCRVKFNSIKCGRNANVNSDIALVPRLIQNWHCRVCLSAESILNAEYSIWGTNILSDEGLKFYQKLSANGTRRRLKVDIAAGWMTQKWRNQIYRCLIYCQHNLWIRFNMPEIQSLNQRHIFFR